MNDSKNLGIRLEDGVILPTAVEKLADRYGMSFCDVFGFGELEWVELSMDNHGTTVQRFEGPLHLIALNGRVRIAGAMTLCDFVCTFSRQTDNGIQVLGGKLHSAAAVFVELTISPLQPLDIEKKPDLDRDDTPPKSAPTRELTRAPAAASPPFKAAAPPLTEPRPNVEAPVSPTVSTPKNEVHRAPAALDDRWAKAVLEAKRLQEDPTFVDGEEESDRRPKRGDIVQHAQFGECQVSRIDDDHITLRKPDGRNVQLGLTVLRFVSLGKQKGKDAYRVQIGKR